MKNSIQIKPVGKINDMFNDINNQLKQKNRKSKMPNIFPGVDKSQKTFGECMQDCMNEDPELRRDAIDFIAGIRK